MASEFITDEAIKTFQELVQNTRYPARKRERGTKQLKLSKSKQAVDPNPITGYIELANMFVSILEAKGYSKKTVVKYAHSYINMLTEMNNQANIKRTVQQLNFEHPKLGLEYDTRMRTKIETDIAGMYSTIQFRLAAVKEELSAMDDEIASDRAQEKNLIVITPVKSIKIAQELLKGIYENHNWTELLSDGYHYTDLIIAVGLVTGRRSAEIMHTAVFEPLTTVEYQKFINGEVLGWKGVKRYPPKNYMAKFRGQVKKKDLNTTKNEVYYIPLLAPVEHVIYALSQLDRIPHPITPTSIEAVNQKYSNPLNLSVKDLRRSYNENIPKKLILWAGNIGDPELRFHGLRKIYVNCICELMGLTNEHNLLSQFKAKILGDKNEGMSKHYSIYKLDESEDLESLWQQD